MKHGFWCSNAAQNKARCVFEVSLGSNIEPEASAELLEASLLEASGAVSLRRWIRGAEQDVAGAAAVAERQAVVRATEKRVREDQAARDAAKKAREEDQAEAKRQEGLLGTACIDRLRCFDGTVELRP